MGETDRIPVPSLLVAPTFIFQTLLRSLLRNLLIRVSVTPSFFFAAGRFLTRFGTTMTSTIPHLACPTSIRQSNADPKKLRSACDSCHQCKVKCSGGSPCYRCTSKGLYCRYSYQNRAGKPKGSKNRRTLEREHQLRMERLAGQLRNGNRDFENSNLDMLDLSTLLPESWEQSSTVRLSSDWLTTCSV